MNEKKSLKAIILPYLLLVMMVVFIVVGFIGMIKNIRERIRLAKYYDDYKVVTAEVTDYKKCYDDEGDVSGYKAFISCPNWNGGVTYFQTDNIFESKPKKTVKALIYKDDVVIARKDLVTFRYLPLDNKRENDMFMYGVCFCVAFVSFAAFLGIEKFMQLGITIGLILLGIIGVGCGISGVTPGYFMIPFGLCGILLIRKFYILTPEQREKEEQLARANRGEVEEVVEVYENEEPITDVDDDEIDDDDK